MTTNESTAPAVRVTIYEKDRSIPAKNPCVPEAYRTVFHGYVPAGNLTEIRDWIDRGREGTYQGSGLGDGDVIELEEALENHPAGCYRIRGEGWESLFGLDTTRCEKMKGIRALLLQPGCPPAETRVRNDLASLQRAVSEQGEDALIEITYPFDDDAVILGNEEAKLNGMKGNRRLEHGEIYAGPLLILRDDGRGDLTDLREEQIAAYARRFAEPDVIPQEEVEADCGYQIFCW